MATVLFVDDEPEIVTVGRLALGSIYTVLTATSGLEALGIVEREVVVLIISDQCMPGMTGAQMLRLLRTSHPGLRCIISTGYAEDSELQGALDSLAVNWVLRKPWSPKTLRAKVAEVLAADNTPV